MTRLKASMRAAVALLVVVGFLAALGYMLVANVEPGVSAGTMVEALKACLMIAVGYYLGSSEGSARKTELMEKE